jgi:hypothetical protein
MRDPIDFGLNARVIGSYLVFIPMKTTVLFLGLILCLQALGSDPVFPTFRPVTVDTNIQIGYGIAVADVDGDGKLDIVLADKNQIVWYQNPSWSKHVIAEQLTQLDHVCLAVQDIDGDGKAEIAVGAGWNPGDTINSGSVHYLIPPADRTQKWEPVQLHHEPTVHRMRWIQNRQGGYDLVVVPLHGRGNKGGEGAGVKVLAYKMPANPRDPWKTELIDDSLNMTHNFDPVRWKNQPGTGFLLGGKQGVIQLTQTAQGWERRHIIGNAPGQSEIIGVGEVRASSKGDFIVTIEPMHGNQLVAYTPPKDGQSSAFWKRTLLDDSLADGHALACGDLLGTGSDQVVVGWRAMNMPGKKVGIKLFAPLNAERTEWKQMLVDDNQMACEDLVLADINGNGRLDIIAAGRATKNVKIYFNEGPQAK